MMRIKIPFGGLTADQMDVLADLAEEYSDEVCHITTRQDVQLHYVHIDDTPDLMRGWRPWVSRPVKPAGTRCVTSPRARWLASAGTRPSTSRPTPRPA